MSDQNTKEDFTWVSFAIIGLLIVGFLVLKLISWP